MTWFTFSPEEERSLTLKQSEDFFDNPDTGEKICIDIDQHSAVSTFATVTKTKENNINTCIDAKDLRDEV